MSLTEYVMYTIEAHGLGGFLLDLSPRTYYSIMAPGARAEKSCTVNAADWKQRTVKREEVDTDLTHGPTPLLLAMPRLLKFHNL